MAFPSVAQYFVVELLSIIFLECLPEEDLQVVRTLRDMRNDAPISVSQVCQHWRYVSFSTHRLWVHLKLVINRMYTSVLAVPKFTASIVLVEEWRH